MSTTASITAERVAVTDRVRVAVKTCRHSTTVPECAMMSRALHSHVRYEALPAHSSGIMRASERLILRVG